jgi:hypothetical protein
LKVANRNQCQRACACYRCDNEQPTALGSKQVRHNFSCNVTEIETQRQSAFLLLAARGNRCVEEILAPTLFIRFGLTKEDLLSRT